MIENITKEGKMQKNAALLIVYGGLLWFAAQISLFVLIQLAVVVAKLVLVY